MKKTRSPQQTRRDVPRTQRGSAYLLALLVLVVLAMIGLSLALVTQTEEQIGSSEKEAVRALYAADSGIAVSVAQMMVNGDPQPLRLTLNKATRGGRNFADRVAMSTLSEISEGYCDLCMMNSDRQLFLVNYASTAWQSRQTQPASAGPNDPWTSEISNKTLAEMIALQPWDPSIYAMQGMAADPDKALMVRW